MNELFEKMKNDYEIFCRSAQRFMDAVKGRPTMKNDVPDKPDYNSWIGKVVYVWDDSFSNKQKAILLWYNADHSYPFRTAGGCFKYAELCEDE